MILTWALTNLTQGARDCGPRDVAMDTSKSATPPSAPASKRTLKRWNAISATKQLQHTDLLTSHFRVVTEHKNVTTECLLEGRAPSEWRHVHNQQIQRRRICDVAGANAPTKKLLFR